MLGWQYNGEKATTHWIRKGEYDGTDEADKTSRRG